MIEANFYIYIYTNIDRDKFAINVSGTIRIN